MKCAPLLLLLSSVLLSSHLRSAAARARVLPRQLDERGRTQQLNEVLLRARKDGSDEDKTLGFLLRDADSLRRLLPGYEEAEDAEKDALKTAAHLLKRSGEPPLSIDLTFHLLRNMIQMAKTENQREQALLNRKFLDEVGK